MADARPGVPALVDADDPSTGTAHRRFGLRAVGLRARVSFAFAIGALLLSVMLSGLVIGVTRTNLINQRESQAAARVNFNALNVRGLVNDDSDIASVLSFLPTPEGSRPILLKDGEWFSLTAEFGRDALPEQLREVVAAGQPARMRFTLRGDKQLAVGVPVADLRGAYFEIVEISSLDETLSSISFTLFGASITVVLAGAALGWYASRRILRPLTEIRDAAFAITANQLDTRIETLVDPDLEPIVTSFNSMAEALEQRIERDARFASDVSHELRSPLMTLQASIEVLENGKAEMSERTQSALDLLIADVNRFRQLVEDLLEMSRFDAGVMTLELQEVLISDFVRHLASASGHEVEVLVAPELEDTIVAVDPRRIARVVANLLENAAKYGDGATHIEVARADDDRLQISVDDSGPGVPEEDRDRIFERFSRAGAANRRGAGTGVGLGLALVAEHVRLHEGAVWVTDAPGGGARFVVDLPMVELDYDDDMEFA